MFLSCDDGGVCVCNIYSFLAENSNTLHEKQNNYVKVWHVRLKHSRKEITDSQEVKPNTLGGGEDCARVKKVHSKVLMNGKI